jgi:cytochrome c-type biogenesis protein CcmE
MADRHTAQSNQPRHLGGKTFAIGALVIAAFGFILITAGGIGRNLVYYWGPTEVHAAGVAAVGATIRLGGLVAPGSVKFTAGSSLLEFDVTDATDTVHVRSTGIPPQMFREGIGVVVEGTMTRDGYFASDRLMVKHGNEYRAPIDARDADPRRLIESTEGLDPKEKS